MKKLTVMLFVAVLSVGCASSSGTKSDASSGPMHDPPEDRQAAPVPDGPDTVIGEGGVPETYKAPEAKDDASVVTRAQVEEFMDRGPSYVLTVVTVDPSRNDSGNFVGYQIVDVTQQARDVMMPQLRVGDVVTHVNGVRLEKPDDLIAAWKALKQVDVAVVDFTRQGEPMQASWTIE
jgi:S1-C subfamily serine protease